MRNIIGLFLALAFLAGVINTGNATDSTRIGSNKTTKTAKKKGTDQKVWISKALALKTFGIEVNEMFGPNGIVNLPHTWLILLQNGRMETTLPYVGRYSAPNLTIQHPRVVEINNPILDYKVDTTRRGFLVKYKVHQTGENFEVELRIDKNGYTTVYLYSSLRSDIRYTGQMKMVPPTGYPRKDR